MASSLIQPYIDDENVTSMQNGRKSRVGSVGSRPNIAKTFGNNSQPTPRKPLGNLSNDPTARQPLSNLKNTLQRQPINQKVMKKPPPLSHRPPGGLSIRKSSINGTPAKSHTQKKRIPKLEAGLLSVPTPTSMSSIPDIEKMFIYEEPDLPDKLPQEDCLSRHLDKFLRRPFPIPQPVRRYTEFPAADFSSLKLEEDLRPIFNDLEPLHKITLASCLDLPPVETQDFMDFRNLKLWEDK